jgi:hypothetical protein
VVNGDVDRGKALLQKVIEELAATAGDAAGDPRTLAWAHVWLGRIHEGSGRREQAEVEYRAALGVPGAPDPAKAAAQRGLAGPTSQAKP